MSDMGAFGGGRGRDSSRIDVVVPREKSCDYFSSTGHRRFVMTETGLKGVNEAVMVIPPEHRIGQDGSETDVVVIIRDLPEADVEVLIRDLPRMVKDFKLFPPAGGKFVEESQCDLVHNGHVPIGDSCLRCSHPDEPHIFCIDHRLKFCPFDGTPLSVASLD